MTHIADLAPSITDNEVLALAVERGALLITNDLDFGELVYGRGARHTGVLLLRLEDMGWSDQAALVARGPCPCRARRCVPPRFLHLDGVTAAHPRMTPGIRPTVTLVDQRERLAGRRAAASRQTPWADGTTALEPWVGQTVHPEARDQGAAVGAHPAGRDRPTMR